MRRVFLYLIIIWTVAACTDRSFTAIVPSALAVGTPQVVFAGTTRALDESGRFGFDRSETLGLAEMIVTIPPGHQTGTLKFSYANPDPETEFSLAAETVFDSRAAFRDRVRQALLQLPPGQRDVSVFVHGYNATQAETAFRATQLHHDLEVPGLNVIYSWPSRGAALGYIYDHDSALFARDGLESLLLLLKEAGADRLVLIAHSMGSVVTVETLRQLDLSRPGWPDKNLGGVLLISPDINVDVFRTQVARMSSLPQPFIILTSSRDKALNLSAIISGSRDRLGSIEDTGRISDLPVRVINLSSLSNTADSSHFIAATSPAFIALANDVRSVNKSFGQPPRLGDQATVTVDDEATLVVVAPPTESE